VIGGKSSEDTKEVLPNKLATVDLVDKSSEHTKEMRRREPRKSPMVGIEAIDLEVDLEVDHLMIQKAKTIMTSVVMISIASSGDLMDQMMITSSKMEITPLEAFTDRMREILTQGIDTKGIMMVRVKETLVQEIITEQTTTT